jgi:exosortase
MISVPEAERSANRSIDTSNSRRTALRASFFPLLVLATFWALLIYNLGAQWSAYEQYNYGWAVPFLCLYLLYRRLTNPPTPTLTRNLNPSLNLTPTPADRSAKSEETARVSESASAPLVPRPSSFSPLVPWSLLACCLAYAPTRWLHEANPIWRVTSWLWALEVVAITLLVLALAERSSKSRLTTVSSLDTRHSTLDKPWSLHLFFPIAFFLVAVPWPSQFEGLLVNSLTSLNVSAVTELLSLFGIPAVPHGNTFEISSGVVGVDEACSGIRSFQATLMLSLFFGEFYSLTLRRRLFCVFAGFAFSMIFNIGRTLLLVYVGSSRGIKAIENWHDPAGTTILVSCFVCLWLLALWLRPKCRESKVRTKNFGFRISDFGFRISLLLLAWLLAVELGTQLWYRSHETSTHSNPQWSLNTKPNITDFKIVEIPFGISAQFYADENTEARWQDELGRPWQLYYFRWHPGRSPKKRVAVQMGKAHGPEKCLPAIGMTMVSDLGIITTQLSGVKIALQHFVFGSQSQKVHVFYGIHEDPGAGAVLANRRQDSRSRIAAAFAGSRNYGQQYLELAAWGYDDPADARKALNQQLTNLIITHPQKQ